MKSHITYTIHFELTTDEANKLKNALKSIRSLFEGELPDQIKTIPWATMDQNHLIDDLIQSLPDRL